MVYFLPNKLLLETKTVADGMYSLVDAFGESAFLACRAHCSPTGISWTQKDGAAVDVGTGADISMWVLGTNTFNNNADNGIFQRIGASWNAIGGFAVRISVGSADNIVVVNSGGGVYKYNGNGGWNNLPGINARDVAVSSDGSVWAIENTSGADGPCKRWNGSNWIHMASGYAHRIDAASGNRVAVSTYGGAVYAGSGSGAFGWSYLGDFGAKDVSIAEDGTFWLVKADPQNSSKTVLVALASNVGSVPQVGQSQATHAAPNNGSSKVAQLSAINSKSVMVVTDTSEIFKGVLPV